MPDPTPNPQPAGRGFLTRWTIIWIAAWFGLFVIMHTRVPLGVRPTFRHQDLVLHFCAYFALALIGSRSALSRQVRFTPRWLIKWLVIYAVYCAADELLQGPVNRNPSALDWAADVAGAAAALAVAYVNRPVSGDADSP